MLKKLRIGQKLALAFAIVLILNSITCVLAIRSMRNINARSTETFETRVRNLAILDEISEQYEIVCGKSKLVFITRADADEQRKAVAAYNESKALLLQNIETFSDWEYSWEGANEEGKALTADVEKKVSASLAITDQIIEYSQNAKTFEQARQLIVSDDVMKISDEASAATGAIFDYFMNAAEEGNNYNIYRANKGFRDISSIGLLAVLLAVISAVFVSRQITGSVKKLQTVLNEVAQGNLSVNIDTSARDEIGALAADIERVVTVFKTLTDDLHILSVNFQGGDIDSRVDATKFKGEYQLLAGNINTNFDGIMGELKLFTACIDSFGAGNFSAEFPQLPGKKASMNETIDSLRSNLRTINKDVSYLVGQAIKGDLSTTIDVENYNGDWRSLVSGLNSLVETVYEPISELRDCLEYLSIGNFAHPMAKEYQGEFDTIKSSLNITIQSVWSYIDEISAALEALANNNLDIGITREFKGDFDNIKRSLNMIVENQNDIMNRIRMTAKQVDVGSKQVMENSTVLAEGAVNQSNSVELLNEASATMSEQADKISENAEKANLFAEKSKENVAKGNKEMKNMLVSMEGMKESSNSIAKIIKIIDDIAFQTNLLALNAAVEAARAGEHGKGFAVVAEEVRSLASRSQAAAKDSNELIIDTVRKVNESMQTAKVTDEALSVMIEDFNNVSDIVSEIADLASLQARSVTEIHGSIERISSTTLKNSATSEESAAAAQELSSQSDILNSMIAAFKLKGENA